MTRSAAMRFLIIALLIVGAALRLWQYLANTSAWLDEVAVARNVLDRSLWSLLTTPLSYDQTAPMGFLVVEKIMTLLFGRGDYALRFFPLVCSLIALVAFWRVAERLLDGLAVPAALALFGAAVPLVAFGSQIKQYSSDVAVALLLLWLALELTEPILSLRRALWAGIAGAVLICFSQSAVLVACGLSIPLIFVAWNQRREKGIQALRVLSITLGLWAASSLVAILYGLASMPPATRTFMHRFWAAGFPPADLRGLVEARWPLNQMKAIIGTAADASLGYPVPIVYLALAVIGLYFLWNRNRVSAALLLAPIVVTIAAAAAGQYPFSDRLILFLVPAFFIALGASSEEIRRRLVPRSRSLGMCALLLIAGLALSPMILSPPVYHREDMKPVLSYLEANRRPGDLVYVYYGAAPAVTFYAAAYGLHDDEYAIGGCHRGDNRRYFEELDAFRGGRRVWVLITHSVPRYREDADILRYLGSIGVRHDRFVAQSSLLGGGGLPAEAFLYDLSDPERLSRAMPESSPVTGASLDDGSAVCGEGPQAMTPPRGLPARGLAVQ